MRRVEGARASRPGFTLLEMMLASLLGGVVVASALGIAIAMQRSEERLGDRGTAVAELATLHGIVQEAMLNIVATDAARPVDDTIAGGAEAEIDLTQVEAEQELERPRIILGPDPALVGTMPGAGGNGEAIQSLEIVLREPPAAFALARGVSEAEADEIEQTRSAVRGVFELRPEQRGSAYELWWRPVLPSGEAMTIAEDEFSASALRLCGGITALRWQMLKTDVGADTLARDRLIEHQATWVDELPAYVELEVATEAGVYANWMFEIGWTQGPEIVSPPTEDDDLADGADGQADGGAAGGQANGQGGRASGRGGGRAGEGTRRGGGRDGGRRGGRPGGRPPPATDGSAPAREAPAGGGGR